MSSNGIAGSNGSSVLNSQRNFQASFHSGQNNLHSHQQCISVLISLQPCQHLLFFHVLIIAILTGVRSYLVVLVCVSLMISDAECLFHMLVGCICVLAIVNSAAVNIHVYVSLQYTDLYYFGHIPSNGIAGLNCSSLFSSLRNCCTAFPNSV